MCKTVICVSLGADFRTDRVQPSDVLAISTELGKKWMWVGRLLELEDTELEGIKDIYRGNLQECCIQMLTVWTGKYTSQATFERLGKALSHPTVHLRNVAENYCGSPNGIIHFKIFITNNYSLKSR